ncbi:zinc-binding alcohol dehydrogenase family protein [Mycobacterium cookii]|nr:zinc-binding alcohol dehydrogenase family protein [Mycobacterium cookii]
MKAWLWDGAAGIEHIRLEETPDPVPGDGEVILKVDYAALNPADRMMAERRYPYPVYPPAPHVLGRDRIGTVVRIGAGVDDVRVGDQRVLLRSQVGLFRWGMFAEQVSVPANVLAELPPGWTPEQCAGAAVVYLSAYRALTMWEPLEPESVVLVTGGSGGVGVATVQLATAMGHTVIALSRSPEKQQRLAELGATFTLNPEDPHWPDRAKELVGPRGVKLAVDTIGGTQLPAVIETMGDHGRLSLVGQLGGVVPNFDTGTLFSRWLKIGAMALSMYTPEQHRGAWHDTTCSTSWHDRMHDHSSTAYSHSIRFTASLRPPHQRADGQGGAQGAALSTRSNGRGKEMFSGAAERHNADVVVGVLRHHRPDPGYRCITYPPDGVGQAVHVVVDRLAAALDQSVGVDHQTMPGLQLEELVDVRADLTHLEVRLTYDREHTARLDAAGDMDRFASTVVEIDGRADRDEVIGALGLRVFTGHPVTAS